MSKQTQIAAQKEQMKRMSERNRNTQPTLIEDFDVNNLVFDEPLFGQIPNQPIKYHTINIGYRNPDKTVGELVFELRDYSSFGITENRDAKTQELQGYSVGISFGEYNQKPTEYDIKAVEVLDSIAETSKDHLLKPEVYKACKLKELYRTDLRYIAPHAQKKDKITEEIIEDSHFSIYPKLMWTKEKEYIDEKTGEKKIVSSKFKTELWDDDEAQLGNRVDLNPLECIGKRCRIRAFVKVDRIFVGSKIKVQLKLYSAGLSIQKQEENTGYKSLFRFNAPRKTETVVMMNEEEPAGSVEETQEEETFSVPVKEVEPEEEEEEIVIKPKATKGKGKK
jgi:hypothetical protein